MHMNLLQTIKKILMIFRFIHYIWFIDSENVSFVLILNLPFNIVHFPNFEISASK